jgi:hypothetical protein
MADNEHQDNNRRVPRMPPVELMDNLSKDILTGIPDRANGGELPPYVDHAVGVNRVGQLTAAAIIRDYEETAKTISEMSEEMNEIAQTCERYMLELRQMVEELHITATGYRERGAEIFRKIEESAKMTEDMRNAANLIRENLSKTAIFSGN